MRVMTFCTYSLDDVYGGPLRVKALHRVLQSRGMIVRNVAVTHSERTEPAANEHLFPIPHDYLLKMYARGGRPDIDAADYLLEDAETCEAFYRTVSEFAPEVIMVEQAWLWPVVKEYLKTNNDAVIVYGSHNVESALLEPLLKDVPAAERRRMISKAKGIEIDLAKSADLITTVSEGDAEYFGKLNDHIVVCPNGAWPRDVPGGLNYWARELGHLKFLLFVGSAHPPNAAGFGKLLGPSASYLSPLERIAVVGGVSGLIWRERELVQFRGVNLSRTLSIGYQSTGGLSTLIELSLGIILPITEGGGTNLKTAEALYSRCRVVGTSLAFRGFERFMDFPGVHIADTPEEFRAAVLKVLRSPKGEIDYSLNQELMLDRLLWSHTLGAIPDIISSVYRRKLKVKIAAERVVEARLPELVFGWHEVEMESAVWTSDHVSCFKLAKKSGENARTISFQLDIIPSARQEHVVSVIVGDKVLARVELNQREPFQVVTVRLENEIHSSFGGEVFIHNSALVNPYVLGLNVDDRQLGVLFSRYSESVDYNGLLDVKHNDPQGI